METVISPEMQAYQDDIRRNARWKLCSQHAGPDLLQPVGQFHLWHHHPVSLCQLFTDSAVLIGLIPAIQNVGYFLPQLLMAQYCEQLARKKPFVVKVSVMERLPYCSSPWASFCGPTRPIGRRTPSWPWAWPRPPAPAAWAGPPGTPCSPRSSRLRGAGGCSA
jgi:hypothetical protein